MKTKEYTNLPKVITGRFYFHGINIYVLIYAGSMYSYICNKVVKGISLDMVYSETNVLVTNPLGQSTVVNKLIRDCPLVFDEHTFLADLLMLSFHEFDAILKLD